MKKPLNRCFIILFKMCNANGDGGVSKDMWEVVKWYLKAAMSPFLQWLHSGFNA